MKTLESNIDAINMSRVDSAFDIDPLFHKMSKTFDEGGAKGMLLANLAVSPDGPQIVFDSKADSIEGEEEGEGEAKTNFNSNSNSNNQIILDETINISSLNKKLNSLLGSTSLETLQLVPQLSKLRSEFDELKRLGHGGEKKAGSSKTYGSSKAEETEAEEELVKNHLEKSRRMSLERSMATAAANDESQIQSLNQSSIVDDDDDDDNDNDAAFDDFLDNHDDGTDDYNNESFLNADPAVNGNNDQVDVIINAISEGKAGGSDNSSNNQNLYQYFDENAMEAAAQAAATAAPSLSLSSTGATNSWAGASHWKR